MKILVVVLAALAVITASLTLRSNTTSARADNTLEDLASYRTWTRVTKEPIKGAGLTSLENITVAGDLGG